MGEQKEEEIDRETVAYFESILHGLVGMAKRANLPLFRYLFGMARLEARRMLRKQRKTNGKR